ncbi:MAG: tyrosine-type recombinase/integrase [Bacteroidales bacterium]|nr:tyrosine-type recombinase/integrase [Bacteroidales bacterium]
MISPNYIQYLESEKRSSALTVKSYLSDLEQFSHYLVSVFEINNLADADSIQIRGWISDLTYNKIESKSISRKLSSLRSYYRFLQKNEIISKNPMETISSPKIKKRLPVYINVPKADELLNPDSFDEGFVGMRDKLILDIFYSTGIRLSELINIKDQDISFYDGQIKIFGKGQKERIIPISINLSKTIKEYITLRDESFAGIKQIDCLFVTIKGIKMYPKSIYRIVRHHMGRVTTQQRRSPHILRHTFATHLLNEGADINAIKELMGHANLSATQVYTHNSISKLKNIYKQAHPRA